MVAGAKIDRAAPVMGMMELSSDQDPDATPDPQHVFYYDPDDGEPFQGEEIFDEEYDDAEDRNQRIERGWPVHEGTPLLSTAEPSDLDYVLQYFGMAPTDEPGQDLMDEAQRRADHHGKEVPQSQTLPQWKELRRTSRKDAKDVEQSGSFEKRSPWWVEGWRPRSFILKDRKLIYYKNDRPDRPLGVLDFTLLQYELHCCWLKGEDEKNEAQRACDVCINLEPENWSALYLKPRAFPSKVFAFRGPLEQMQTLAENLAKIIASLALPAHPLIQQRVLSLKNFWRYPFIHERDFVRQVQNGDILLFNGTDRAAKLQRAATGAMYDHVGLLLRTVDDEVLLLEATGRHGVGTVPWELFKAWHWHEVYTSLAYRKVYFPRTHSQLTALQMYVCSVLGMRYGLTVRKLTEAFGRKDSKAFDENGDEITNGRIDETTLDVEGRRKTEDPRAFFCSELVAACLKRCGVIASKRASSYYWPGSFSQHSFERLLLHENVRIGEEQIIVFDD